MTGASPNGRDEAVGEVHLAYKTILYFTAIAFGGLLWITLNRPFQMMMGFAGNQTTTSTASDGQGYIIQIWEALPLVILLLAAFGLIVAAVRESEIR